MRYLRKTLKYFILLIGLICYTLLFLIVDLAIIIVNFNCKRCYTYREYKEDIKTILEESDN